MQKTTGADRRHQHSRWTAYLPGGSGGAWPQIRGSILTNGHLAVAARIHSNAAKNRLARYIQLQECAPSNQPYEKIHLCSGQCCTPRGVRAKDRDNSAGDYSRPNRGACSRWRLQSCYEKRISSGSDSIANWDTAAKLINSAARFFFCEALFRSSGRRPPLYVPGAK